ncbi:MAG: acetylornithine transaminase [Candidatus Dactylopiibacterium carminicum]|uniref:Acetylornithine aminotransferase n=1 Tax=Candidatus Dactylopiibacterium carminicum TaxID=857335 RepID=A0A272EQV2_9RHOO|nr:acetylornithine transaminase [Candidatus Dactylopiibacterium carminicum]KAF7598495.1 acetylornithine transaminase [Candidatus Dactylopiibacterium carminicum]PAS92090.1 MAG: acetylornithine transaminase [Candidatus Dactylopiibacterium carminicum]PAS95512.1 MAG: acetylornithine transaminase [Candidatus Dactylopiibacterium carminicum]PAS97894.1 MAG: acetylornithine transaminase [Candidatus Dactylopiibacterium carminicum]
MTSPLPPNALMPITPRPDLVFVRGEGAWLFDAEGRSYLDWVQGWAVNALGHSPRALVAALTEQAAQLINPSPSFYNQPALALAGWLTQHSRFDQVFFTSSGAEANEGAIKLARKWGQLHKHGAHEIITFQDSFHGRTLATMAATGKAGWDTLFAPAVPGFVKARYNDANSVRALIGPQTAAVILEPIQGEAGVIPATPAFLQTLRTLCDEHGLLLIADEVQTGCGRTGVLFAHELHGMQPDIMTLGKDIGGGVPLAALLARADVCCFAPGDQGGTYCGNPLMCAAGLAVMRTLGEPAFLAQVRQTSELFRQSLQTISARFGLGEVRGEGLLLALALERNIGAQLVQGAREHGLLLNSPRPALLRFMPALNTTPEEIALGMERLGDVLAECLA